MILCLLMADELKDIGGKTISPGIYYFPEKNNNISFKLF